MMWYGLVDYREEFFGHQDDIIVIKIQIKAINLNCLGLAGINRHRALYWVQIEVRRRLKDTVSEAYRAK